MIRKLFMEGYEILTLKHFKTNSDLIRNRQEFHLIFLG